MLPVVTALEPIMSPVVLTLEIAMQPAVLSPRHVVVVVGPRVLMLQPVVRAVMLSFQPVVLAIMTMGIAGVVGGSRHGQRGCCNRECRSEKERTHLTFLYLSSIPARLAQVR